MSSKPESPTARDGLLRTSLLSNAAFSACTGAAMAALPGEVATHTGLDTPVVLRLLGLGLLAFAGGVAWTGTRGRLTALPAVLISFADLLWVAGSAALVLVAPRFMGPGGAESALLVAAVVLGFGVTQLLGVRRLLRETALNLGTWRHCLSVDVDAPPEAMWQVVSDLGSISQFVPSLVHSELVGDVQPAPGAVRACSDSAGRHWEEVCIDFEPRAKRLSLRFRTEADGFPYPMREMHGGWEVSPHREGSRVTVWWSVTPTTTTVPWLLVAIMGQRLDVDFPSVIARMAAHAAGRSDASTARPLLAPVAC